MNERNLEARYLQHAQRTATIQVQHSKPYDTWIAVVNAMGLGTVLPVSPKLSIHFCGRVLSAFDGTPRFGDDPFSGKIIDTCSEHTCQTYRFRAFPNPEEAIRFVQHKGCYVEADVSDLH